MPDDSAQPWDDQPAEEPGRRPPGGGAEDSPTGSDRAGADDPTEPDPGGADDAPTEPDPGGADDAPTEPGRAGADDAPTERRAGADDGPTAPAGSTPDMSWPPGGLPIGPRFPLPGSPEADRLRPDPWLPGEWRAEPEEERGRPGRTRRDPWRPDASDAGPPPDESTPAGPTVPGGPPGPPGPPGRTGGPGRYEPDDEDTAVIGRATAPVPGGSGGGSPRIAPGELAGLSGQDDDAQVIRRVVPLEDEASQLVARYLFPTERYRGEWRRHVINLAGPVSLGVLATFVLGWLAGLSAEWQQAPWLATVVVLLWLGVMGYVAWRVADWNFDRFILTNKRVMKVSGIFTRDVAMMPLSRVTDMKYLQSPTGRVFNYGTFVLESAGQDQALREVPYLPDPNELYLRVVEEMYEPNAVEARLGGGDSEAQEEEDESTYA